MPPRRKPCPRPSAASPALSEPETPGIPPAPSTVAPSKVWRICQGEPVEEKNAGRLARDFGRLTTFMDRHVFQAFLARQADAAPGHKPSPSAGKGR